MALPAKDARVQLKAPAHQIQIWKAAADAAGVTLSEFLRQGADRMVPNRAHATVGGVERADAWRDSR